MKLEQLILNVELQGIVRIKIYDYDKEEYTHELNLSYYDHKREALGKYGDYRVTFIYPYCNGVAIEITKD